MLGRLGDVPCPTNPPPPPGTVIWTLPVSHDLEQWAIGILNDPTTFPMLSTAYAVVDGQPVVARVEHHTWIGRTGQTGVCIRGVTLYHPTVVPFVPASIHATVTQPAASIAPMNTGAVYAPAPAPTTAPAVRQGPSTLELLSLAIVAFTSAYGIAAAIFYREHHPELQHLQARRNPLRPLG
jgi:hypothetical protein